MRILELEIINFGKFNHETVTFHDGMNLIYGENEMGKTTLHSFIRGMFFGIEKQRGRAARKDEYSIREPWFHAGQFAGIMRFESGGKIFRLERNFYRKEKSVSLVCETNGEVLSVEKGDLQVLMEGMNEDAFRNTVFFNQQSAATDEGLARELRNYMTNLQNSGDGEMNVSAAIKSLESQRRHLESEQKRLDAEQAEELESQQMRLEYVRQELLELSEEQKHCEVQMARIAKERIALQARLTEKKRSLEKMKRELDIPLEENAGKDEMESWKMRMEAGQDKRRMLWRNQELWLLGGGVLALLVCILVPHIWISALVLAGWLGISAIFVWKIYRRHQEEQERQERIQKRMQERMKKEIQAERERSAKREKLLEEKYHEEDELAQREKELNLEFEKQMWNQERISAESKEKQVILNNLEESLQELQEENEQSGSIQEELDAVRLAIMTMNQISEDIYKESAAHLNQKISDILSQITEGRYTSVFLDANMEVRINTPKKLLSLEQVSRGTMQQIYFALRMAVGEMFCQDETMPIILDDAFVMYDDKRLKQTLKWLYHSGRQVILFTCHGREQRILDEIKQEN